jgi:hypothetical protein
MKLDQEVDVERIALVNRGEKRSPEPVARHLGSEGFREANRILDCGPCVVEPSRVAMGHRRVVESEGLEKRVVGFPAARGLAETSERLFVVSELSMKASDPSKMNARP